MSDKAGGAVGAPLSTDLNRRRSRPLTADDGHLSVAGGDSLWSPLKGGRSESVTLAQHHSRPRTINGSGRLSDHCAALTDRGDPDAATKAARRRRRRRRCRRPD